MNAVPFLDLSGQYQELEAEWLAAVRTIGSAGTFILGPNVAAFEQELAAYVGTQYAVAVANGTDALVLSLRALGIGPGDEVITTPFTFFATAEAVTLVGAKPVFVDIEEGSFNIDSNAMAARINAKTRAVIPVHLFGNPVAMSEISTLARDAKLVVIEDCAQAFGATIGERRVGDYGDTGCFSFYPTKVLGCFGDGGIVTTSSEELRNRLLQLRNHGASGPMLHNEAGYNSRLDEIQAALLRIKLRAIDRDIEARRKLASGYTEKLGGLPIALPSAPRHGRHVYNIFTIRMQNRDAVRQKLLDAKIATSVFYPRPLHLQAVYKSLGYRPGDLPVSERVAQEVLSLPIYPGMPATHVDHVCAALRSAVPPVR